MAHKHNNMNNQDLPSGNYESSISNIKVAANNQLSEAIDMNLTSTTKSALLSKTLSSLGFAVLVLNTNLAAAATTPNAYFESAVITGSGNYINVSRVPVVDSTGKVTYKDINIEFEVNNAGVLNMAAFSPTITASPALITSGFKAGYYKDARGNKYQVTGPSVIPNTTRTVWSLAFVAGSDVKQFSMSWITGPVIGHPNQPSLDYNKITTNAYSWGLMGSASGGVSGFPFLNWNNANVVGAVQAGNQLVLHYFTSNANNVEDASASLTYCTTAC